MSVSIILVDDHALVRRGLRNLLDSEKMFQVVGEAGDGLEAVELVERLQPDVLVVDLMIPSLNGLEVTRQVRTRSPQTRVVIVSMHSDEAYVREALRCGGRGYVLKEADDSDLVKAVHAAVNHQHYFSAPLSESIINAYTAQLQSETEEDPSKLLTAREREVLSLAAQGYNNAEIARRLNISPRTASTHRSNLMSKLNIHNQVELVRFALDQNILTKRN